MTLSTVHYMAWKGPLPGAMCYDATRLSHPTPQLFTPSQYTSAIPVPAGGRQAAWFVTGTFGAGVLRHYRRGGLIARINPRHYLWLGKKSTRCFHEFHLLHTLAKQGLAVPAPLAAAYWRSGLTYQAAILVERLPNVQPLAHCLDQPIWRATAHAIARLHQVGGWHADLNAYNILIDNQGQAWIIDFDRGRQACWAQRAQRRNLKRLGRSLKKVAGTSGQVFFQKLKHAYQHYMAQTLSLTR